MKRVGDHHLGHRLIFERDVLGDAVEHACRADLVGQHGAQRLLRLDRDHPKAVRGQRPRQLARPGSKIQHAITRPDPQLAAVAPITAGGYSGRPRS